MTWFLTAMAAWVFVVTLVARSKYLKQEREDDLLQEKLVQEQMRRIHEHTIAALAQAKPPARSADSGRSATLPCQR